MKIPVELEGSGVTKIIIRFFWNLWLSEEPKCAHISYEWYKYLVKIYIGQLFFTKYAPFEQKFVETTSRIWPFSYLFRNSLFNVINSSQRNFMRNLEELASEEGIDICVLNGNAGEEMVIFEGFFETKVRDKANKIVKLHEIFQKTYQTLYVRSSKNGFLVMVASSLFQK